MVTSGYATFTYTCKCFHPFVPTKFGPDSNLDGGLFTLIEVSTTNSTYTCRRWTSCTAAPCPDQSVSRTARWRSSG